MIDRSSRDYSPEIRLFVAEHGEDHYSDEFDVNGRLTFHTFDEDETDPPVPGKEMLSELAKTEHG